MAEVKKMAEALRSGATMLAEPCPSCSSPLFRFKSGEVRCVNCDSIVIKGVEKKKPEDFGTVLQSLERRAIEILSEASQKLETAGSAETATILNVVESCLNILVKIRKIRQSSI
ncbi:MAG: Sjogren's syndrome/scleroderma autoantigen 1 family protein [Thermoproteota archaeon]